MIDSDTALTLTRTLDASPAEVWRAWTDPAELARWWWPAKWQTTYEVDLRVSGAYRFRTAEVPGMGVLDVSGTFLEVQKPNRLVYTWRWEGEPDETRVTVEFIDLGGRTELQVRHEGFSNRTDTENHTVGWGDCVARLIELLGSV